MKMQWLNNLVGGVIVSRLWLLLIVFGFTLSACSDGSDRRASSMPDPEVEVVPQDSEFPDYTVITLESGEDLEVRALEAMITADPKTIIEFPAGSFDLEGE